MSNNLITNLTDTDKTIEELLSEGYQGVNYELIENEGFVATANHFTEKIQWLKTSPDEDGDIGLMTIDIQAFDELLDFMLDKFGWCPMVYSNKSAPEINIFTPENELEEMAIALTTDGEYGWKGSLYRLAYVEKYENKIGLIFATKPEDSNEQDWLLVQIDQKNKERGWSVHDGTLEQVYYIMAEEIEIPEPNYNPTPEQIAEAINSQTSEKIPIHLLEEEKVDEWNQWKFEHQEEELNLSEINLSSCNLSNANLQGANLSGADLSEADLSGANLSGANLKDADLKYADLTDANLNNTDLSGADLTDASFTSVDVQNVKGLAPIYLCQIIPLDSLSDEEAISLYEEVATYLIDNDFEIRGDAIDFMFVQEYLMPLWMRFNWREIEYSDVKFYNDYDIKQAIPYAYLASSENFQGYELLSRILDKHDEFNLQKCFNFLEDVILILVERLWGHFFELDIYDMETQVAFLVKVLIEDYLPSKNFPTNYTMDEIDGLLYYNCHCIVELDSSELERYDYVSPCVLSGLLNCYRDVFGDEQFEGFFNPEEFPDLCNQNLTGINLSNIDLSNIDLSGANLTDADLSHADLSGADLTDADLTDANLEGIITDENTIIEIPEE